MTTIKIACEIANAHGVKNFMLVINLFKKQNKTKHESAKLT